MSGALPHPNIEPLPGAQLDSAALAAIFIEIQRNFDALALAKASSLATPWQAAPFSANWKNYETGFQKVTYRKAADGRVVLRGLAQPLATGQKVVFILPIGFRPALGQSFACAAGNGVGTAVFCRVDVAANGEVSPVLSFTGTSSEFYLFLDTISFYPN